MNKITCIFIFFMVLFPCHVNSQEQKYMILPVVSVYDGDTIKVDVKRMPFPLSKMAIRIRGIDTPELRRAKCLLERTKAFQAKHFVMNIIGEKKTIRVYNFKWGKYGGRIIGDVRVGGKDIGEELIKNFLAVPYQGYGPKHDWCN